MRRRLAPLLALVERRPWLRIVVLVVAGAALALPGYGLVHALAPTTQVRGVVTESTAERDGYGYRSDTDYTVRAVTADGEGLDLEAGGAGLPLSGLGYGSPVVISRSTADGRVTHVRSPFQDVTVANHVGSLVLQLAGVLVAAAGITVGLLGAPHRRVRAVALLLVGAVAGALLLARTHETGRHTGPLPDAMYGYADPPTTAGARTAVASLVPIGTTVATFSGGRFTVTGPPELGRPPGLDPDLAAGFEIVRLPVRVDPGAEPNPYGAGESLPNMDLIGSGTGRVYGFAAVPETSQPFASCPGAAGSFPSSFAAPRSGVVCFVVPDDFVPRYLVLINDDTAVRLAAG